MFGDDENNNDDNKNETKKTEEVKFKPLELTVSENNDQMNG